MDGAYYDGHSAARHAVDIQFADGHVAVTGPAVSRRDALGAVSVSERLSHAPRVVSFADGAFCELADTDALEAVLATAGYKAGAIETFQRSWRIAAASLVALVALASLAYAVGVPLLARYVASRLPDSFSHQLAIRQLAFAEDRLLSPSKLPDARQQELRRRYTSLTRPGEPAGADTAPLLFRASGALGANAFALADGTVVLLDGLIALADTDEQILAVLCHEAGHAHHRHVLRGLLQNAALGAALFAWVGDTSALIAAVPANLLSSKYSRDLESEADDYAAQMLAANALSPARLVEMLDKLDPAASTKDDEAIALLGYLSSHPGIRDRAARIEASR